MSGVRACAPAPGDGTHRAVTGDRFAWYRNDRPDPTLARAPQPLDPMRIAVLSDVHGNLLALEAVLADLVRRSPDLTVNLGDCVSGPLQARDTAEVLLALDMPTIAGNHERQLLTQTLAEMGASDRHAADELRADHWAWMETLPPTAWFADGVFACHGTPESDLPYLLEDVDAIGHRPADPSSVAIRVAGYDAQVILCGHSHQPRIVPLGDGRMVVNPGSVGLQAFGWDQPVPHVMATGSPHARYALLDRRRDGWRAELVRVEYDWDSAADLAVSRGRGDWAEALRSGQLEGVWS